MSVRRQERRRGERQAKLIKQKQAALPKRKVFSLWDRLSADWIAGLIIGGVVLVIAAVFASSWFFSARGGEAAKFSQVFALAVSPSDPNRMFVGDVTGLHLSNDGGKKWSPHVITDPVREVYADPNNANTLYAVGGSVTRRSTDGGLTWSEWTANLPKGDVQAMASDPADSSKLYAYVGHLGLYKSEDGGASWTRQNALPDAALTSLAVKAGQPDTIYAFHNSLGLVASSDNGKRFDAVESSVLPHRAVSDVLTFAQEPETVYAVADQGLYKSTDGAKTWVRLEGGLSSVQAVALSRDPGSGKLYLTDWQGAIFVSADAGATWQRNNPG